LIADIKERSKDMGKRISIVVVALLVVAALVMALGSTAMAQEDDTTPEPKPFGWGRGFGHGFGHGVGGQVGLEAAAEALGMTADELSTQLWGGNSLADLADEAGVDLQAVQDAVNAALEQAQRDAIEQAVTDGTLTREHADWLLDGLDQGFWGGTDCHGFGGHGGFGDRGALGGRSGFRGHGGFGGSGRFQSPAAPSTGTGL
jgi:hypothetical protein